MAYLSTFFQIDQVIRLQCVSECFSTLLDSTQLIVLISNYLNVQQLVSFLSINKKARKLLSVPVIEVRVLKGELHKLKHGNQAELDFSCFSGLKSMNSSLMKPLKLNMVYSLSNIFAIKGFYSKLMQMKNSQSKNSGKKGDDQLKNKSNSALKGQNVFLKQINQNKLSASSNIQQFCGNPSQKFFEKQEIVEKVQWIDISPPTISDTFSQIHTQILNTLENYYEKKEIQQLKSKSIKHGIQSSNQSQQNNKNGQMLSFLNNTVTKFQNFIEMVKFLNN